MKKKHISKKQKTHPQLFSFLFLFISISCVTLFIILGSHLHNNESQNVYTQLPNIDEYLQPTVVARVLGINATTSVVAHGDRTKKYIALTFDADMTPGMVRMLANKSVASFYDNRLIDVLNKTHTKATFFMTGLWIKTYPKITQSLAKNPLFELENHSYSHGGFSGNCYGLVPIPNSDDYREIIQTRDLLKKVAGVKNKYFRFPGGCYDAYDLQILASLNIIPVQWDVVADDGFNKNRMAIEKNVLSQVQNGSIIVMHMNGYPNEPQTANAVADLIPILEKQGYILVKLSELL